MKSSTATKVEHRLQVAFYHEMLATLLEEEDVAYDGTAHNSARRMQRKSRPSARRPSSTLARGTLCSTSSPTPQSYRIAVRELVTDRRSTVARVADAAFATIPYHLIYKCDGCLYNEVCVKKPSAIS